MLFELSWLCFKRATDGNNFLFRELILVIRRVVIRCILQYIFRNLYFKAYILSYRLKLDSFKEEQLPYGSNAASYVGAAVLAHVARSGGLPAALR